MDHDALQRITALEEGLASNIQANPGGSSRTSNSDPCFVRERHRFVYERHQ
jgi:hypothetical protein